MRNALRALALAVLLPLAMPSEAATTSKAVLSAVAPGAAVYMVARAASTDDLPPSILCLVSPGAALIYNVEVTGDSPDQFGSLGPSTTWFPLDPSATAQTTSGNYHLASKVTAVRVNVTSYTSGTLTFEVVQ